MNSNNVNSCFNSIYASCHSFQYREISLIRPPMVLDTSTLNTEQVSLTRPIWIENCILVLKQMVLIVRGSYFYLTIYCISYQGTISNIHSLKNTFCELSFLQYSLFKCYTYNKCSANNWLWACQSDNTICDIYIAATIFINCHIT